MCIHVHVGGHLDVARLLVEHAADVDSQDNRKVSCLMAAFRRVSALKATCTCTCVHHAGVLLLVH